MIAPTVVARFATAQLRGWTATVQLSTTPTEAAVSEDRTPRQDFRVLTRQRGGYDGGWMMDVQLQVAATGSLVWAQTFSDTDQAEAFRAELEEDLTLLDAVAFRRKYGVPAST